MKTEVNGMGKVGQPGSSGTYNPGVCNIGPEEIRRRRNSALVSALITLILAACLILAGASRLWRLTVFLPAASFGVGLLQWQMKFCVNFGSRGVFNFGEPGQVSRVMREEDIAADRRKVRRMIALGVLTGLFITFLTFLIPVLPHSI